MVQTGYRWDDARMVTAGPTPSYDLGPTSGADEPTFAGRLTRLARIAADLMMADNLDAVTKIVVTHAGDAAGASVTSLSLLVDEDTLALVGINGASSGVASKWATYPVTANTPASDAVRTCQPVIVRDPQESDARYPGLLGGGNESIVCLPLRVAARAIGAIGLAFRHPWCADDLELEFYGILADTCAQAIDRIRAVAEAEDQTRKLEFLARASDELASSLDYETTLARVAHLGVPHFADWCSIALAEDGELRTLAVAHVDPAKRAMVDELQRRYPPKKDVEHGAYAVLRTGVSQLIPEVTDEMLVAGTQDEEHLRLCRELNLRSALVVPLNARGRVLGVLTWVSADEGRRFTPADLTFGEDLGRRAAVAIDNAQLYSQTHEAAIRLQEAVLPDRLAEVPGWDVAALYSPAGRTDVGGDFYDVIALPDGRLACFVGDVMGRGVGAAAAMAQMRAALRAYIALDPDPAPILDRLGIMFEQFEIAPLVTLLYLVADPARDIVTVVNAGHPPPLLVSADGTAEHFPYSDAAPLGVADDRPGRTVPFRVGDTLLVYTDGLIERRGEDIDHGQRRLAGESAVLGSSATLESGIARLVDAVRDHTREDDVAAVALRRTVAVA